MCWSLYREAEDVEGAGGDVAAERPEADAVAAGQADCCAECACVVSRLPAAHGVGGDAVSGIDGVEQ